MSAYKVIQDRPSATRFSPIYGAIQTVSVSLPTRERAEKRARTWSKRYGTPAIVIEFAGNCPVVFTCDPD